MKQPNFAAMSPVAAKAIEQMMAEQGDKFSLEKINLAELERRTGISRARLGRMKGNGFEDTEHAAKNRKANTTLQSDYTSILDGLLMNGVANFAVCLSSLRANGYTGSRTTIKNCILAHQHFISPARYAVAPQGNRGRRYTTGLGEAFQMDWSFAKVKSSPGKNTLLPALLWSATTVVSGMLSSSQTPKENLFIGMLHGFQYMGGSQHIFTDNMKSAVIRRDQDGHPLWQRDYEHLMRTVGFQTKLCRLRHPFTKGKVERLVCFAKDSFLDGRSFWNVSALNLSALD